MPHSGTQKCTISSLRCEKEQLEKVLEGKSPSIFTFKHVDLQSHPPGLRKDADTLHQNHVQEQIPWPQGHADRLNHGFCLMEEMSITKEDMNTESVRSALHANIGGPYLKGMIRYNAIDIETLKIVQDEILIEHAWIKQNYEESWPIPALIKTAIENCENVKWIPGLQCIAPRVSQNNTAIDNVAIESDTELGNHGNDPTKSDEESDDSCTKFDGGHTESDDDQIESDDYHAKAVGNQGITGKARGKGTTRIGSSATSLTRHHTQDNHRAKKCKVPSRIRLHLPSKNKYIDDALTDEDIDPLPKRK
ncbi:uncharacterized protein EI90DRAFT_3117340 [Cantharellus anzutake]|uniref:uncharacterized protein n=1 Tax=Cantharellus anzutake TaxID=1750568 RepID=UPI001905E04F|nr:uncharacterized protein EI90DRAFT_3117340 [Cantharellus anzutake]KAF8339517.1 hypothetical protein EI90DRAFT_3117340 [Cantharellus anzutake]